MKNKTLVSFCFFPVIGLTQFQIGLGFTTNIAFKINYETTHPDKYYNIGNGFSLDAKYTFKKVPTSSIVFGFEYSSIRHTFFMNGFSLFLNNSNVKILTSYKFNFQPNAVNSPFIGIGINHLIQTNAYTGTIFNKDKILQTIDRKAGYYPLMFFAIGLRHKFKNNNLDVSLGLNYGFNMNEKIKYEDNSNKTEINLSGKNSYIFLKLAYFFQLPH